MDNFDVWLAYIAFNDVDFGKVRPTVVVEIQHDSKTADIIPIYSHKENWNENSHSQMIKVQDTESAGLTNIESYFDISRLQNYPLEALKSFTKIGHLADHDIDGLLDALERYYL